MFNHPQGYSDIWNDIFNKLSDEDLIRYIDLRQVNTQTASVQAEQTSVEQMFSESTLLKVAITNLFNRSGEAVSRYQNIALGFWLKKWRTAPRLSFIKNEADKQEWLNLLKGPISDPSTSVEHKVRCCLLINKLYPDKDDRTPKFVEVILEDALNNLPVKSELSLLGSELSNNQIKNIADNFFSYLRTVLAWRDSSSHLIIEQIMPYASNEQYDATLSSVCNLINEADWYLSYVGLLAVASMIPRASKKQIDTLFKIVMIAVNHVKSLVRQAALAVLSVMVQNASQEQFDEMLSLCFVKVNDEDDGVSNAALSALSMMVTRASAEQCEKMAEPIFRKLYTLSDKAQKAAESAVKSMVPKLSQAKCDELILSNMSLIRDELFYIRNTALNTLSFLASRATKAQCNQIAETLLAQMSADSTRFSEISLFLLSCLVSLVSEELSQKMTHPVLIACCHVNSSIRVAAESALKVIVRHLPQEKCNEIITSLLDQEEDYYPDLPRSPVTALSIMMYRGSKERWDEIIAFVLMRLIANDWYVRSSALAALVTMIPHASQAQCEKMLDPVLELLYDVRDIVRSGVLSTLSALASRITEEKSRAMIEPLMRLMHDERGAVYEPAAVLLARFVPMLSCEQMNKLLALKSQSASVMALQIITQTTLHINRLTPDEKNDKRISFKV